MAIFSDGFESGDISKWTATAYGGSGTITVETNNPHQGTYDIAATISQSGYTYLYKTLSAASDLFLRCYIKFLTLPSLNNFVDITMIAGGTDLSNYWQNGIMSRIINNVGGLSWGLRTTLAGVEIFHYEVIASNPVTGVWYCLEIERNVTLNLQRLWVNEQLKVSSSDVSNLDNNVIQVGFNGSTDPSLLTSYQDDVVANDHYIGIAYPMEGIITGNLIGEMR